MADPAESIIEPLNNFIRLSTILLEDFVGLYEGDLETPLQRRNFVRASVALFEGVAHCYLDLCAVAVATARVHVSKAEDELIQDRRSGSASDRMKLALRLVHRIFETGHQPDFSGAGWAAAQQAIGKRHLLMHPKAPRDLSFSDDDWRQIEAGIVWMQDQQRHFVEYLKRFQAKGRKPPEGGNGASP